MARANTREEIVSTLRAHQTDLRRVGIVSLSLFGSIARGDARPDSDVDVAIRLDPDLHLGFKFFGLAEQVGALLGREVHVTTEPIEKERLRVNVGRDRVHVF